MQTKLKDLGLNNIIEIIENEGLAISEIEDIILKKYGNEEAAVEFYVKKFSELENMPKQQIYIKLIDLLEELINSTEKSQKILDAIKLDGYKKNDTFEINHRNTIEELKELKKELEIIDNEIDSLREKDERPTKAQLTIQDTLIADIKRTEGLIEDSKLIIDSRSENFYENRENYQEALKQNKTIIRKKMINQWVELFYQQLPQEDKYRVVVYFKEAEKEVNYEDGINYIQKSEDKTKLSELFNDIQKKIKEYLKDAKQEVSFESKTELDYSKVIEIAKPRLDKYLAKVMTTKEASEIKNKPNYQ